MWRIELIGEPRVIGHGQTISRFESKRAVALLAYLALHPLTRHPRETLVDRIWPDASVEAGRNRLKQALASLRRQLEPPFLGSGTVIDADRSSIGLRPESYVCDVTEFWQAIDRQEFDKAKILLKGELLPGFYDEWIDEFRFKIELSEVEYGDRPAGVAEAHKSVPERTGYVPSSVTTFIGREVELNQLMVALESKRLVSITGFGGLGKTRLAQQLGHRWALTPVWFVSLAEASGLDQALNEIVRVLGLGGQSSRDPSQAICECLQGRATLIILDNVEHLVGAEFHQFLKNLLERISELKILLTSRVALHIEGETEYPLWPMEVPERGISLLETSEYPSVRLFVDRARQSRPDFQITPNNFLDIAEICRRLEGIPLGLELCAAWSHFGMKKSLERLEAGAADLSSRTKDKTERHHSLRNVFSSTFDALSPEGQSLLMQLSSLRGQWDWEWVEAVCEQPPNMETLSELINASLVRPVYETEPPKFAMLESLRQFASSLMGTKEQKLLEGRFCSEVLRLASLSSRCDLEPNRNIKNQADWIHFFSHDWFMMAHAASILKESGQDHALLQLALDTEWYWSLYVGDLQMAQLVASSNFEKSDPDRGFAQLIKLSYQSSTWTLQEVDGEFKKALDDSNSSKFVGETYLRWAKIYVLRQDMSKVKTLAQEAMDQFELHCDVLGQGQCHHLLANCAIQEAQFDNATDLIQSAELCFKECRSLINLAAVAYTKARLLYVMNHNRECLQALYECRDAGRGLMNLRSMGRTANLFGVVLRRLAEERPARVYFYLSLVANVKIREVRGSHMPLWNLFLSLGTECRWNEAVPVMAVAMKIWDQFFRHEFDEEMEGLLSQFCQSASESLGEHKFASLESFGKSMTIDEIEGYLRGVLESELSEHAEEAQRFFSEPQFNF